MTPEARSYLHSRLYTDQLIDAEGLDSVPEGYGFQFAGVEFNSEFPAVVFPCRMMSGVVAGVSLASYSGEKRYEWRPSKAPWLPICYATEDDWRGLHQRREVILVEGAFDRIAVKRALPDFPVIARLSKSVWALRWILARYARRVWVAFDQDEAGDKGARQLIRDMTRRRVDAERMRFLGKDPASHAAELGVDQLGSMLQRQISRAL